MNRMSFQQTVPLAGSIGAMTLGLLAVVAKSLAADSSIFVSLSLLLPQRGILFFLCGASLWLLAPVSAGRLRRWMGYLAAAVVGLLSFLLLLQSAFPTAIPFEGWLTELLQTGNEASGPQVTANLITALMFMML